MCNLILKFSDALINRRMEIHWTEKALAEVTTDKFMKDPRYQGDPKGWHERQVLAYIQKHSITKRQRINIRYIYILGIAIVPYITSRQRKPAHCGGTGDPNEREHMTVSFKKENPEARHIYTVEGFRADGE